MAAAALCAREKGKTMKDLFEKKRIRITNNQKRPELSRRERGGSAEKKRKRKEFLDVLNLSKKKRERIKSLMKGKKGGFRPQEPFRSIMKGIEGMDGGEKGGRRREGLRRFIRKKGEGKGHSSSLTKVMGEKETWLRG